MNRVLYTVSIYPEAFHEIDLTGGGTNALLALVFNLLNNYSCRSNVETFNFYDEMNRELEVGAIRIRL